MKNINRNTRWSQWYINEMKEKWIMTMSISMRNIENINERSNIYVKEMKWKKCNVWIENILI